MSPAKRPEPAKRLAKKVLEIIVSTLQDAIDAQAGGADRLEIVRDLASGGLTPDIELVRQIAASVRIPIRVMLRENGSMHIKDDAELQSLRHKILDMRALKVDGWVAGFLKPTALTKDAEIDLLALQSITGIAPEIKLTFHRAFDHLPDPLAAIRLLKTVPQVDRILTIGGEGSWPKRKARLHHWQHCAAPEITILAGAGLLTPVIADLQRDALIREVHIGRAARTPQENHGTVSRLQVAQIKGMSA